MILTPCPSCGDADYNPILFGCRSCGFQTPWMSGSPTTYLTVDKAQRHNFRYIPGGSLLVAGSSANPARPDLSMFLPEADVTGLVNEAARSGSLVWNSDEHGNKRLNVIYAAGRVTGVKNEAGALVSTFGVRFALWDRPEHIHPFPANVPEPADEPYRPLHDTTRASPRAHRTS